MSRLKIAGKGSAAAAGTARPQIAELDQSGAGRWNKLRGSYVWRSPAYVKAWAVRNGYQLAGKRQK